MRGTLQHYLIQSEQWHVKLKEAMHRYPVPMLTRRTTLCKGELLIISHFAYVFLLVVGGWQRRGLKRSRISTVQLMLVLFFLVAVGDAEVIINFGYENVLVSAIKEKTCSEL